MKPSFAAGVVAIVLVLLRASCEHGMMREYGPDAQMGIWYMFSAIKLLFWLGTGLAIAVLLAAVRTNRRWSLAAFGLILTWAGAICWSSARYFNAKQALHDAAATSTSPERLRALTHFDGIQAGYELDNRIASNPNTPPEVLRLLHGRTDQVGTEMCLARNPNTPDEILLELANRNDEWSKHITDSLKHNPKYGKLFGSGNVP